MDVLFLFVAFWPDKLNQCPSKKYLRQPKLDPDSEWVREGGTNFVQQREKDASLNLQTLNR